MNGFCELILGGARSGKSALAEQRAQDSGLECVYVATATAGDGEMRARIAHHRQRRDSSWALVEEPVSLADALLQQQGSERCILVDCLTLWLSNCLHQQCWPRERARLLEVLPTLSGHIILVSNETGLGVVPMGELSRQFVDEAGFLHQRLAALCQQVTLTVAGLPLSLKSPREV
ncbi:MAG: bifunctional adenosylcobinamide kinase/adenosylcobinamide-phosphate guanylyltransferase [Halioglobus sp.]|nr:bifunctional adenosylcobinamide kinase/adenosylcobinamide-phosphate guanylyltransferase [Halioglobus sp.]